MLIVLPCIDTLLRYMYPPTGLDIDLELFNHACAFGGWHCLQKPIAVAVARILWSTHDVGRYHSPVVIDASMAGLCR